jgi:hypothetical protein
MSRCKIAVGLFILALIVVALFVVMRPWAGSKGPLPGKRNEDAVAVGPSKANFNRLRPGMTLAEVEAVLGPVGLSYSSDTSYEYYIAKGKDGWSRVWVRQGKVSELSFDPTLSLDD